MVVLVFLCFQIKHELFHLSSWCFLSSCVPAAQHISIISAPCISCCCCFTMGIISISGASPWISCFILLLILFLCIVFFITCCCYPLFIVLQHNIVILATSGLIRLDLFRYYFDLFSMDSAEFGWYLSHVTSMLVSFLSFILSGAVFGMIVLISVDVVKRRQYQLFSAFLLFLLFCLPWYCFP